jgi:hypothetical protein
VCLNMLRSRKARREQSLAVQVPNPVAEIDAIADPDRVGRITAASGG